MLHIDLPEHPNVWPCEVIDYVAIIGYTIFMRVGSFHFSHFYQYYRFYHYILSIYA